jgi:osmoprotectant transport system permease protein
LNPWDWIPRNIGQLAGATLDHVVLTLLAVSGGLAISFALALVIRADRRWYGPLTGVTGTLYTIPSLALFAVLVPVTGLSVLTAEIGLVSYTLLVLLRNLVAGLDAVPPDVRDAAMAMGLSPTQRLARVELPLAMPYLIAGLRVATVTTIGLVMVTALIGEGGLGQVMLRGFNFRNWTAVYVGAALTVVLAFAADLLLVGLGRILTPWARANHARGA